jgi:hypothetical protein
LPVYLSTRPVHLRRQSPIRRRCKASRNVAARRVTFLLDLFLTTVSRQLLGTRNVVLTFWIIFRCSEIRDQIPSLPVKGTQSKQTKGADVIAYYCFHPVSLLESLNDTGTSLGSSKNFSPERLRICGSVPNLRAGESLSRIDEVRVLRFSPMNSIGRGRNFPSFPIPCRYCHYTCVLLL